MPPRLKMRPPPHLTDAVGQAIYLFRFSTTTETGPPSKNPEGRQTDRRRWSTFFPPRSQNSTKWRPGWPESSARAAFRPPGEPGVDVAGGRPISVSDKGSVGTESQLGSLGYVWIASR